MVVIMSCANGDFYAQNGVQLGAGILTGGPP